MVAKTYRAQSGKGGGARGKQVWLFWNFPAGVWKRGLAGCRGPRHPRWGVGEGCAVVVVVVAVAE